MDLNIKMLTNFGDIVVCIDGEIIIYIIIFGRSLYYCWMI